jgi:hypothetical protein
VRITGCSVAVSALIEMPSVALAEPSTRRSEVRERIVAARVARNAVLEGRVGELVWVEWNRHLGLAVDALPDQIFPTSHDRALEGFVALGRAEERASRAVGDVEDPRSLSCMVKVLLKPPHVRAAASGKCLAVALGSAALCELARAQL